MQHVLAASADGERQEHRSSWPSRRIQRRESGLTEFLAQVALITRYCHHDQRFPAFLLDLDHVPDKSSTVLRRQNAPIIATASTPGSRATVSAERLKNGEVKMGAQAHINGIPRAGPGGGYKIGELGLGLLQKRCQTEPFITQASAADTAKPPGPDMIAMFRPMFFRQQGKTHQRIDPRLKSDCANCPGLAFPRPAISLEIRSRHRCGRPKPALLPGSNPLSR